MSTVKEERVSAIECEKNRNYTDNTERGWFGECWTLLVTVVGRVVKGVVGMCLRAAGMFFAKNVQKK